ncbi:MAG: SDR family oxidoreductase [Clostridiales bacterium]|jgi:NAD(P)-dependent dehydrogenase (short-subunit alcohol dehydrogenase family)|nr:SDR family oxidoreductase [Clostridiales bacterium]
MKSFMDKFSIEGKVCVITGGAGLLGKRHAQAILTGGGIPALIDISDERLSLAKQEITASMEDATQSDIGTYAVDITDKEAVINLRDLLLRRYGHIDILINNAANNPKMEGNSRNMAAIRFHDFPLEIWNADISVGLTGAFLCSQTFGKVMEDGGGGVILNISSDYGLISPDQRVYRRDGVEEDAQIVKPISYSVVKRAIIGMTKYLATYWAKQGIRVNTLCPASLFNGQDIEFVKKISELIPMGRMSDPDEYICTVLYMISDASSYMTGSAVIVDGGRTSW